MKVFQILNKMNKQKVNQTLIDLKLIYLIQINLIIFSKTDQLTVMIIQRRKTRKTAKQVSPGDLDLSLR